MYEKLEAFSRYCYRPAFGLLLIRVVTGLIFLHHGWLKLQNVPMTIKFMGMLGIPAPLAYLAIFVEVIGGLMLIFGVYTRAAAVATGIVGLVAAFAAKVPQGGFASAEFEVLLAAASFGIAFIGSGKYRLTKNFE